MNVYDNDFLQYVCEITSSYLFFVRGSCVLMQVVFFVPL